MCMSAKVPATVRLAKKALEENKCVVIGLQSTGEARTEEAVTKYVSNFLRVVSYNLHDEWLQSMLQNLSVICSLCYSKHSSY